MQLIENLQRRGVVLLRGILPVDALSELRDRVSEIAALNQPFAYSISLAELVDTGMCEVREPASALAGILEDAGDCRLDQSFLRKRFAPANAPRWYQPNTWHQDGGLGVAFTQDPDAPLPMTRLVTCWVPLDACGRERPGLEFVCHPLDQLLHYTELDDAKLRQRFPAGEFWAPEVELGDALVFLPGTLHRTFVQPEMQRDRLSLEYRYFPRC